MTERLDVVEAARGWLGTPYVHQASAKFHGTDCLGLLRGVWRELYGAEPVEVPPYTRDWDEVAREDVLWRAGAAHLVEREAQELLAGDVVLFRMREGAVAKHLGIVTVTDAAPAFIHAYTGHGVVESSLSRPWRRRICAVFSFPPIAAT